MHLMRCGVVRVCRGGQRVRRLRPGHLLDGGGRVAGVDVHLVRFCYLPIRFPPVHHRRFNGVLRGKHVLGAGGGSERVRGVPCELVGRREQDVLCHLSCGFEPVVG